MNRTIMTAAIAAATLGMGHCSAAGQQPASGPAVTKSLQGEQHASMDTAIHMLYDVIMAARAKNGPDKIDVVALDQQVRELSRSFSGSHDLTPKAMEDHVVDMTHQMLAIGKKDPKIFDSVETFAVALRGPN
jgi:hypothetical protein